MADDRAPLDPEERSPRSTLFGFADALRREGWIDVALLQDMAAQELVDTIVLAMPFVEAAAARSDHHPGYEEAERVLAKMRAAIGLG